MKIITLHCDFISFKPLKKALKGAEEVEKEEKTIKEVLVVLTAVEKNDESNPSEIVKKTIKEIKDIAAQVKAENIVLYPYAHLSSQLSSPEIALKVMKDIENQLKKELSVCRAPFGWYKEFDIKCKGHPLSELSREITVEKTKEIEEEVNYKQLLNEISKTTLDREKLKDNDHRILGKQMDLFSFNETAPGMVFWHNNGLIIYEELIKYWKEKHRENNYEIIKTPQIMDSKLWKISGHWRLYREHNFLTKYEKRDFLVKPMNCPGGMLVYKNSSKSYKDLPLRVGELGIVHRTELSGVLSGLFRVIQFTQDDAHIFCTKETLESEIIEIIELIKDMLGKFGFEYRFTLSTRSKEKKEKYLGDDQIWNTAEEAIKKALKKLKIKFNETPGEAKFYGPSLDVQIKDSLGREWQCSTIQLDMQLPERFELEYIDKNGEKKQPIMLHRVIYGSLERFIGVLLEHTNGNLPLWLAPIQARILSFTDRNKKSVEKLVEKFKQEGIRTEIDIEDKTMNHKIRAAEIEKVPYIIVIGDKEEKAKTLAVREKGKKPVFGIKEEELIKKLKDKIKDRIL